MKKKFKFLFSIMMVLGILCLGFSFGGYLGFGANEVYAINGGAVYLKTGAKYTMGGGSIKNKTAERGGAVFIDEDATFTMNGGTISGCSATYGGAVYVSADGMFDLNGGTIKSCSSTNGGDGVYIESGGTLDMSNGTIEDEVFTAGSMVYTGGTVSGTITLAGAENLTIGTVPEEPLNVTAQKTDVGTKLIKVTADDFDLSDVNISGLPTGRRVILSGGYVVVDYVYYTITWKNADGTVLETDTVAHGTTPTYDGATPTKASTAQYSYAFKSWDSTVVAATANKTYTATYTATTRSYKITIAVSPSGYGSVDKTSVTVPYGTSISASGATLTVGSNTITASATTATAQYTYAFSSWTGASGTVTGTKTITANFTRTTNQYTVTLGTGYGSWDTSSAITVDYGTAISVSSNKLTVGSTTRTFTKSANTDQYTYTFNSLSGVPSGGKVVANVTITPSVTRTTNQYTVTLGSGHGSWDTSAAITVDYGTAISVSSNKLTVGSTTRTWTTSTDTAQYDYTFNSLSGVPSGGKVVANVTITPSVSRATKSYTVTIAVNNGGYGSVDKTSVTVNYGTSISASGATLTVGSNTIKATATAATAQYTYAFSSWTGASGTVTEAKTITANFTRTTNQYIVTLGTGYGSWDTSSAITVDYGTAISVSSNKLTVGSTTRTFTKSGNTDQYTYTFNSLGGVPSDGKVIANVTISPSVTRTTNQYTVTLGTGYGSWDTSTAITVDYGTAISVSSNKLTVGSTTRTFTASADTAQYDYTFNSLSGVPSGGKVVANVTITPSVSRATKSYTVTIAVNNSGYGSVDKTSVTVNYGTSISASGATLTVGSNTIKATATAATAQYTYAFSSWSDTTGTITGTKTITANFTRTTNQYKVTLVTGYGSWDTSTAITVDYGTAISVSSNKLTVGSTTRTWTTSETTAQYSYSFNSLGGVPSGGKVIANVTITPSVTRTLRSYTVTLASGYGSWDNSASFSATYGTSISISSNKVTVGSTTRTFTASADTAQYDYTFTSLSKSTSASTITGAVTITPNVSRVTKTYMLSYSNGYYYATNATDITVTATGGTLSRSTINGTNTTFTLTATYSTEPISITFTRKNTNRSYEVWWDGSHSATNTITRTWTPTANESCSWYIREYFTVTATAGTGISSATFGGTDCWGNTLSATSSSTLLYGASLKFSASVSTGYTWSKWSDGSTTQTNYEKTTSLNSDISLTASATINRYTVTLGTGYGSWNTSSAITVDYGTAISVSSNKLTVGSTTRTWTTSATTAQYSYSFNSLGGVPSGGKVTGNVTITPSVTRTLRTYTVTWKNGSTTLETDTGVAYGTTPTYNGATPTKSSTAQYSYTFSGWSPSVGAITGNTTYTAEFIPTTRTYTVKWKNGSTTLETDTGVAYGDTPTYNGATPTKAQDAQYTYTFSGWSPSVGAITGDTTYGAQFTATLRSYTITIAVNTSGYGTVSKTSVTVNYGTSISTSGTTLTIGSNTITATPTTATAQYSYAFSGWSNAGTSVTGAKTITANFTQTLRTYTVTWEDGYYNVVEVDYNVPYGTMPTYNGGDLSRDEGDYYAEHDGWYPEIRPVTGDITYEAAYTRSINQYTLTFNISPSSSGYFTDSNGKTYSGNSMSLTVCYGTEYIVSDNQIYLIDNYSGSGFELTIYAHANSGYNFDAWSWDDGSGTIESDESITANFEQSVVYYNIYFVIEGLSEFYIPGYLTSGNTPSYEFSASVRSGTSYTISGNYILITGYGSVYAFASIGYEFLYWNEGDEEGYIDCDMTFYAKFISPENKVTIVAYGSGYVEVEDEVTGVTIGGLSITIGVPNGATIEDYGDELLIDGRYHVYVYITDGYFYGFYAVTGPGVSYDVWDEDRIIYAVFDDYETLDMVNVDINGMNYQFVPGTMIRIYGSGRIDAVRFDHDGNLMSYYSIYPALGLDGQTPVYYYISDSVNGEFSTGFYAHDNYDGIVMYQFYAGDNTAIEFYT